MHTNAKTVPRRREPKGETTFSFTRRDFVAGGAVAATATLGRARVAAKADRAFRAATGAPIGPKLDATRLHLFDAGTTRRLDVTFPGSSS